MQAYANKTLPVGESPVGAGWELETGNSRFNYWRRPVGDQGRHTRIVTELMMSSCGDLILDQRGDLCTRETWNEGWTKELSWAEHRIGDKLAVITRTGWTLTKAGAEYILSNSIFEKRDQKFLEAVRAGLVMASRKFA